MAEPPAGAIASTDESGPHRVVIVDDNAEVRNVVRLQLERTGVFLVVGEGADGHQAIDRARDLQPSLMLLDVAMPGMSGLDALPTIFEVAPHTLVIVFTGLDSAETREAALRWGAAAVINKTHDMRDVARQALDLLRPADAPPQDSATAAGLSPTPVTTVPGRP